MVEEVAPAVAAADLDRLVQESLERWMTFKAHAKAHAAEKRIPAGRARCLWRSVLLRKPEETARVAFIVDGGKTKT